MSLHAPTKGNGSKAKGGISPAQRLAAMGKVRLATTPVVPVSPLDGVDARWQRLSAVYTARAAALSGQRDLIARVAPGMADGGIGWFHFASRSIEVNGDLIGTATGEELSARLAVAEGVLRHEVGHAEHTRFAGEHRVSSPDVIKAVTVLEEIRMEAAVVRERPGDALWIRAAADTLNVSVEVTSAEAKDEEHPLLPVAHHATVTLGRVHAGTLRPEDVERVAEVVVEVMGAGKVVALNDLYAEVVTIADGDTAALVAAAERYVAIVTAGEGGAKSGDAEGEDAEGDTGEDDTGEGDAEGSSEGDAGEGAGEGDAEGSSEGDAGEASSSADAIEAMNEALREALADAPEDAADSDEGKALTESMESTLDPDKDVAEAEEEDLPDPDAIVAHGRATTGSTPRFASRRPLPEEQRARRSLSRRLLHARVRDRSTVVRRSDLPPGGLRMGTALHADVERASGRMVTAQPWRQKRHRSVPTPRIRLAVIIDGSGSMATYINEASGALWALTGAIHDNGGKVSAAVFGERAALLPVGVMANAEVTVPSADGCWEAADDALRITCEGMAAHGGPKMVAIISDGYWVERTQDAAARARIARLRRAGVPVVHIGIGDTPADVGATEQVVITHAGEIATIIGDACVRATREA